MNKYLKMLPLIFITITMITPVAAQRKINQKKLTFEMSAGINLFGPAQQMSDLMIKYGFDETTQSFFSSTPINHPFIAGSRFTYQLRFTGKLDSKNKLGLLISSSKLQETLGASTDLRYLFVKFSNTSVIPVYTYETNNILELETGPALMINSGKKTSRGGNSENYTNLSPGLFLGVNIKIWEGQIVYGKLGTNYLLARRSKMGPYSSKSFSSEESVIPESNISFSHLNAGFILGFYIK